MADNLVWIPIYDATDNAIIIRSSAAGKTLPKWVQRYPSYEAAEKACKQSGEKVVRHV